MIKGIPNQRCCRDRQQSLEPMHEMCVAAKDYLRTPKKSRFSGTQFLPTIPLRTCNLGFWLRHSHVVESPVSLRLYVAPNFKDVSEYVNLIESRVPWNLLVYHHFFQPKLLQWGETWQKNAPLCLEVTAPNLTRWRKRKRRAPVQAHGKSRSMHDSPP